VLEVFAHPDRVHDAREAAALIRALGQTHVRVTQPHSRAWVLKDPPSIARVLAAVEPDRNTLIDIEGITREATAPLLARLAVADAQFLTIAGTTSTLSVWPRRDEAFVGELVLPRQAAFERFRPACAVTWINAHVAEPGAAAVALLPRIYEELDQPELEIDVELAIDAALALALDFPTTELEWTSGAVIALPAGEITTYKLHPEPGFEAAWRATITAALGAIRLR
jgi:hypothetical protein